LADNENDTLHATSAVNDNDNICLTDVSQVSVCWNRTFWTLAVD